MTAFFEGHSVRIFVFSSLVIASLSCSNARTPQSASEPKQANQTPESLGLAGSMVFLDNHAIKVDLPQGYDVVAAPFASGMQGSVYRVSGPEGQTLVLKVFTPRQARVGLSHGGMYMSADRVIQRMAYAEASVIHPSEIGLGERLAAAIRPVLRGGIEEDIVFHTQLKVIRDRFMTDDEKLTSGVGELSFTPVPITIDGKRGTALLKTFVEGVSLKDVIMGKHPEFEPAQVQEALRRSLLAMSKTGLYFKDLNANNWRISLTRQGLVKATPFDMKPGKFVPEGPEAAYLQTVRSMHESISPSLLKRRVKTTIGFGGGMVPEGYEANVQSILPRLPQVDSRRSLSASRVLQE